MASFSRVLQQRFNAFLGYFGVICIFCWESLQNCRNTTRLKRNDCSWGCLAVIFTAVSPNMLQSNCGALQVIFRSLCRFFMKRDVLKLVLAKLCILGSNLEGPATGARAKKVDSTLKFECRNAVEARAGM